MRWRTRRRRSGLHAELLASLAIVLAAATVVLGVVLGRIHDAQLQQLRPLVARSLVREAASPLVGVTSWGAEGFWWRIRRDGRVRSLGGESRAIDPESLALAEEARTQGRALLRAGPPWSPIRFATPDSDEVGAVTVARLPAVAPLVLVGGLVVGALVVVVGFGMVDLRRRVVGPLARLAEGARSFGEGELTARVPVEGSRETADLAVAFNEMTEALQTRTTALEKAVVELRESNQSLREARVGLDRAERLAAVGHLAAGVAHEVGNPMGALLAFLDLAKRECDSEHGQAHLERAAREGERVRTILRQLLDFSRPARGQRVAVALPDLCTEMAELVQAQRRYAGIAIEVVAENSPPCAIADREGVAQVLLNLLLNAADALRGGISDPRIRVTVCPAALRVRVGENTDSAENRSRCDAVELRVEDNGPGVADENREQIFDPFFTTKDPGEGTGLGLANSQRSAEQYGGSLELVEAPNLGGAAFALRLPIWSDDATSQTIRSGS